MRKIDKGFSLVELLIVVIIIGILAGILYLVVGPSDDMVREKACGGNRATIMLALDGYRFSNGLNKENYT
ncbi:MAG: prepilin-type N-terminal cleavage/methylation domain-containing protein, partial [Synergistaceae bacterium]|nr:prepilin-type N-terminal cleavage/methylation domain-containing protein [Synergistaceae bacterium]